MQIEKPKEGYQKVLLCTLAQSHKIEIPSEWAIKKLKDISYINPENIENEYPYEEILYVDIASVDDFQIKEYQKFNLDNRPSRAQRIIQKNDIIISTVRPYLKGFSKITDSKPNLICSTGFTILRPKHSEDVDLIFNFIKGHEFETNMIRQMEGMAYPAVTSSTIANSLIPYSQNNEERKTISSILSNVDSLIQQTQKEIERSQKLKKGLMQKLLTKGIGHTQFKETELGKIPLGWEVVKLKNISERVSVGHVGITSEHYCDKSNGVIFIRSQNVLSGRLDLTDVQYITKEFHNKLKKSQLKEGDLLIVRVGANRGNSCMISSNLGEVNCANIVFARPKREMSNFLNYFFQTKICQENLLKLSVGAAQGVINTYSVSNVPVPIPSESERGKIVFILDNFNSLIQNQQKYKSKLENLKKGLMQKLLTGQIRVKV